MLRKQLTGQLTFTSLRPCDLSTCTKQEIKAYFENSYDLNESLFTSLKDESAFYKCPDRLRLPLIFYFAHTASVYINKMILAGLIKPSERVNLEYETLFETGVDEMSWDDTENYRMGGKFQWPSVRDVMTYRRDVRKLILGVIEDTPLKLPVTQDSPWWSLFMGMEHERIHIETSTVLIRQLPVEMVTKPPEWTYGPVKWGEPVLDNPFVAVNTSEVTLGKPTDFPSYGWDNEYGNEQITVPAFEASKFLVTNREFAAFVRAGGYQQRSYWTQEGWDWLNFRQTKHPTFWVCGDGCKSGCGADLVDYTHCKPTGFVNSTCSAGQENGTSGLKNGFTNGHGGHYDDEPERNGHVIHLTNGQNSYCNGHSSVDENGHQGKDEGGGDIYQEFRLRCMFDVIDMPWDWPAEVNYHEAKAFCQWKGPDFRLPAEAEHHAMLAPQIPPSEGVCSDIIHQEKIAANLNMNHGSSTPVNMYPATTTGFHDVAGNVWEWTEDHFNGLPGYASHHLYDDFSSPCFDGRHNVILGGSWVSTGDEASRFARYAFRRHFFQHAGFRLVRDHSATTRQMPVRLVTTGVYVMGMGVPDNPSQLDETKADPIRVTSTNPQLSEDTGAHLQASLSAEYGVSVPAAVSLVRRCVVRLDDLAVVRHSAAHIGCATGRATLELSKHFQQVLGCDFSGRCVETCLAIQRGETVQFGDGQATLPQDAKPDLVTFKQFTWLPNEVTFADFILLTLLDRACNPKAWLVRMNEILKPQGLLAVASSGHWGAPQLQVHIGHQFRLVYEEELTSGGKALKLSFWQHK